MDTNTDDRSPDTQRQAIRKLTLAIEKAKFKQVVYEALNKWQKRYRRKQIVTKWLIPMLDRILNFEFKVKIVKYGYLLEHRAISISNESNAVYIILQSYCEPAFTMEEIFDNLDCCIRDEQVKQARSERDLSRLIYFYLTKQ